MLNNQQKMLNKCCENKKPGKTKGRQRIEIKQLEKKNNLHVTFTKRRTGLFKKASELCILSGAKIGIIVLSPSPREKPFCFGHPNIDTILDQYLNNIGNPTFDDQDYATTDLPAFEEINKQYEESLKELEKEKKRGKEMEEAKKVGNNVGFWWDIESVEGMGIEELEAYMKATEELKDNLIVRVNALTMANVIETVAQANHGHGFGFAQNPGFGGTQ
ncbi:agamous-like MADS-box protein AGL62 [Durio zibethinus]|uniref:Agamous-like MADS-box protein AGL62 n=1 Tax=Durio zibethinus TaxID=66656 RepID=A0A6P5ZQ86_DURZI|nr:agamous-like MADS-box protein AGL62 [Durio zibethinus]